MRKQESTAPGNVDPWAQHEGPEGSSTSQNVLCSPGTAVLWLRGRECRGHGLGHVHAEAFHPPSQVLGFLSKCGRQEPERQHFQACVIGGGVMHPLGRVPSWLPGWKDVGRWLPAPVRKAWPPEAPPPRCLGAAYPDTGGDTIFRPLLELRADSKLSRVESWTRRECFPCWPQGGEQSVRKPVSEAFCTSWGVDKDGVHHHMRVFSVPHYNIQEMDESYCWLFRRILFSLLMFFPIFFSSLFLRL